MFDFAGPLYGLIGAGILGIVGAGVAGNSMPWYFAIPVGGGAGALVGFYVGLWVGEHLD